MVIGMSIEIQTSLFPDEWKQLKKEVNMDLFLNIASVALKIVKDFLLVIAP